MGVVVQDRCVYELSCTVCSLCTPEPQDELLSGNYRVKIQVWSSGGLRSLLTFTANLCFATRVKILQQTLPFKFLSSLFSNNPDILLLEVLLNDKVFEQITR